MRGIFHPSLLFFIVIFMKEEEEKKLALVCTLCVYDYSSCFHLSLFFFTLFCSIQYSIWPLSKRAL